MSRFVPWLLIAAGVALLASAGVVMMKKRSARRPDRAAPATASPAERPAPALPGPPVAAVPAPEPKAAPPKTPLETAADFYVELLSGRTRRDPPANAALWRRVGDAFLREARRRRPQAPESPAKALSFYEGIDP